MSQLETPILRHRLNDDALDVSFRAARTYNGGLDKPVSDETLRDVYDLMKWGPNERQLDARSVPSLRDESCKGPTASPTLEPGNVEKMMATPVTVVVAYDLRFYEKMPKLAPHNPGFRELDARSVPSLADESCKGPTASDAGTPATSRR